ncbi:hypothetical protein [Sulfoacidibacillus thermotolerans]|uniref:Bacterial Ig domain-containing protein n=1 Tax=Sulfoacidibacillus thermotolerans TaxID=1765684 RepID=A0A2U3D941_SULT2|nr:hypothetical protein [Sulfoacidibacillus thermotolerans]PWI57793.1 hypothetical protein BM613_06255 [Sulfoacidibacillus thermotolerans]
MKKWGSVFAVLIVMMGMNLASAKDARVQAKELKISSGGAVTVEFRVANVQMKKIEGARVTVVDNRGKIIETGLTNREGVWDARIATPTDRRFAPVRKMGTVTALLFADGYNETIVFDVPVEQGQIQPVTLNPIVPNQRNEPHAELGAIHRLTIIGLINHYAEMQKLKKQPPIPGELNYAPWSPRTR